MNIKQCECLNEFAVRFARKSWLILIHLNSLNVVSEAKLKRLEETFWGPNLRIVASDFLLISRQIGPVWNIK